MKQDVSIITVCYNSGETIKRTFDSVLNQIVLPKEYVVIDGLSIDNTVEIIKEYELLFSRKNILFTWVSEKDEGLYDAMNKGVKMASSSWVQFLNSDDYYVNKYALESVVYYLRETKADVVYGRIIKGDIYHQATMPDIKEDKLKLNMLISCPIQQPAAFYKRSLFDSKYGFDTTYKICADYKLFVQMIVDHISFQFIPVYITFFNQGGVSTLAIDDSVKKEDIRLLKECGVSTFLMKLKYNSLLYKPLILFFQLLTKL